VPNKGRTDRRRQPYEAKGGAPNRSWKPWPCRLVHSNHHAVVVEVGHGGILELCFHKGKPKEAEHESKPKEAKGGVQNPSGKSLR
jgi:hypothetical protein